METNRVTSLAGRENRLCIESAAQRCQREESGIANGQPEASSRTHVLFIFSCRMTVDVTSQSVENGLFIGEAIG